MSCNILDDNITLITVRPYEAPAHSKVLYYPIASTTSEATSKALNMLYSDVRGLVDSSNGSATHTFVLYCSVKYNQMLVRQEKYIYHKTLIEFLGDLRYQVNDKNPSGEEVYKWRL